MSNATVLQLYPEFKSEIALHGLYLAHQLQTQGAAGAPFIYASFVMSLDGRIALGSGDESHVPQALSSANDWRLLQELQAQADCFLVGAGYLRSVAAGKLADILQVGVQPESRDLAEWRTRVGLQRQPAIVIPTVSLDIELTASLRESGQAVHIVTTNDADRGRIAAFQRDGVKLHVRGSGRHVEGAALAALLGELGYRSVYCLTGPQMLHTLLRPAKLDRLYLTITHQIIGGKIFDTILHGDEVGDTGRMRLRSLHYDASSPGGAGQCFAQFDCAP